MDSKFASEQNNGVASTGKTANDIMAQKNSELLSGPDRSGLPFWVDVMAVFAVVADENGKTQLLMRKNLATQLAATQNAVANAINTMRSKQWIAPGKSRLGERDGASYQILPKGLQELAHYINVDFDTAPDWMTPEQKEQRIGIVVALISQLQTKLEKNFNAQGMLFPVIEFIAYRAADRFYLQKPSKPVKPVFDEEEAYRLIEARGERGMTLAEMEKSPQFRQIHYIERTNILNNLRDEGRLAFRLITTGGRNREAWVAE